MSNGLARRGQMAHDVAIGVQKAYFGDGSIGESALTSSLTQESFHLEDRWFVIALGGRQGAGRALSCVVHVVEGRSACSADQPT